MAIMPFLLGMGYGYTQISDKEGKCDATLLEPPVSALDAPSSSSSGGITEAVVAQATAVLDALKKYFGMLKRMIWCSVVMTPAAVGAPFAFMFGREEDLWAYIVYVIEMLGPSFIKLAQWASTRPDLFPKKLTAHLQRLQDATRTHPWAVAEATLDMSFGEGWRDVLDLDQSKPIGSGCIAQVYKGTLKRPDGTRIPVACKLIHPHVEENLVHDMNILKAFTWCLECIPSLQYLSLSGAVNTFSIAMREQLDLTLEAEHMAHFKSDFAENPNIDFASPIEGFITRNALVETYLTGRPITEFMGDETSLKTKIRLSRMCCLAVLDMVFKHNFVHGDMHPGNILVDMEKLGANEPLVNFLDCGIVTKIDAKEHMAFVDICLALLNFKGRDAGRLMMDQVGNTEDPTAIEGFCEGIQAIVDEARNERYFEHIGKYVMRICDLSCTYRVKLVHEYLNVAMAVKVCEGISLALDPDLELAKVAIPTILKAQAAYYMGLGKNFDTRRGSLTYLSDSKQ